MIFSGKDGLARNFGQHYAITAGLAAASGHWVVVMDCDLQDRPEEISKLYEHATNKELDVVLAARKKRKDFWLKKIASKIFYKAFAFMSGAKLNSDVANFGIYNHKVIESVLAMGDRIRYFPAMIQWVGFMQDTIVVEHNERHSGRSSYSPVKLIRLACNTTLAFSDRPLKLTVVLGLTISLTSVIIGLFYLHRYLSNEIEVLGFTSLILSIWFLSGVLVFILGILGIYIGKVFECTKGRPLYLVADARNVNRDEDSAQ